jgi:hypothetical protein
MRGWLERLSVDRIALLLWLAVVAAGLFLYREGIATLGLRDADDYLRLVQVRDLLGGQSWFDVTQYRINPAEGGGMMHWSRFVDMQIAALIALLRLFLTPETAERWAIAFYPLLLVLPLLLLLGRILTMLGDRRQTIAGLFIAASGVTFLHYFAPLRIDHHGWQLLLSVAMLWLALGKASFGRGLAAALVIAAHVEISLEGLPYLVIFGALFALEWLRDPAKAPRLAGFAAGLVVLPALWLLVFRGWASFVTVHCDGFSLPYASGVAATGLVLFACLHIRELASSWQRRLLALAIAGAAGGAVFLIFGRPCLGGPFGELEPLVRRFWYDRVMEGQPVWAQDADVAALFFAPTLVGYVAALWAWRAARGSAFAEGWDRLLFVLTCSLPLSMLVFRTGAVAHAYMVPAFGAMAVALWGWSRAQRSVLGRVGGAMLVLTAIPSIDALIAARGLEIVLPANATGKLKAAEGEESCVTPAALAPLGQAPAALVFAPIDTGPAILVRTPHSVIATGHHRNHAAMNRVITAYMSDPAESAPIVRASGATWLVYCGAIPEMENMARANPRGLSARLARGESIDWLAYDAKLSRGDLRIYRILR